MTPIAKTAIAILIKFEIILLTVDKVFFISFIGKLVPNNLQNGCLMQKSYKDRDRVFAFAIIEFRDRDRSAIF